MDIRGRKGAWINQYALPAPDTFMDRAEDVDYLIIKYGLVSYEKMAVEAKKPWLAEVMAELGAGSQNAFTQPQLFASRLASQATQPGCVGAVLNLEEADGGWHNDNGTGTRALILDFRRRLAGKSMMLYASLDTRGNRPDYPYQRVCAELCDGVMPMVYPKAFGQSPQVAFNASINPKVLARWQNRIFPTIQTYGGIGAGPTFEQLQIARQFNGVNVYTLGHASSSEWTIVAAHKLASEPAPVAPADLPLALARLRTQWLETLAQLALHGNADEVAAFAAYWKNLTGKGVNG